MHELGPLSSPDEYVLCYVDSHSFDTSIDIFENRNCILRR
jgi:hypothetical protein